MTADMFINELIRTHSIRLPTLPFDVCKNILMNCVVQCFADSNIAKTLDFSIKEIPLWSTSLNLNKKFMELQAEQADEDPNFDMYLTFLDTPVPLAQQAVYREYQELLNSIEKLDRSGEDWSFKLRTFALPRTDKSLLDKGEYTLSKAAKSFGMVVLEQLELLQNFPQLLPEDVVWPEENPVQPGNHIKLVSIGPALKLNNLRDGKQYKLFN